MRRFLPEWSYQEGILIALPHEATDWAYILDEALTQYKRMVEAFTLHRIFTIILCRDIKLAHNLFLSCNPDYLCFIKADFNDTWTRDYGPICVEEEGMKMYLDFGFNGWGLKFAADKDNLVNSFLNQHSFFRRRKYVNERAFILEGGSVETDGCGTILTTTRCLCSPNRNGGLTKEEVSLKLKEKLGAKHILFLDYGALEGDDTDSHIDTLARMISKDTIMFTGCEDRDDVHFEELQKMKEQLINFRDREGKLFKLIELPLPDPVYDEEGNRLPATYANFLITNGAVFVPTYNQLEKDSMVIDIFERNFPGKTIVGVECTTLIKQHGSLHCATMQLP